MWSSGSRPALARSQEQEALMNEEEKEQAEATEEPSSQMTEEQLRAEIEKHFREQQVDEMLVQFMITLTNLSYIKMGLTEETRDVRDLGQASLAIDAFKSLLEAVRERLPEQDAQALAGALSSMQMTFVKAGSPEGSGASGTSDSGDTGQVKGEPEQEKSASEPGSEKPDDDGPASRLWVPGKK